MHDLATDTTWMNGPVWLRDAPGNWPRDFHTDHASIAEKRNMPRQALTVSTCTPLLEVHKFSYYTKLLRVLAWILRFLRNLRAAEKTLGELTASDLQTSRNQLLQMVQWDKFPAEYEALRHDHYRHLPRSYGFNRSASTILSVLAADSNSRTYRTLKSIHSFGRIPPCYTLVDPPYPYSVAPFRRPRCTIPPQT